MPENRHLLEDGFFLFEVLFKPYNEGEERKGHMKEKRRM